MRALPLLTAVLSMACGASSQLASVDSGDAGDVGGDAISDTLVTDVAIDGPIDTTSTIFSIECGPTDAPMMVIVAAPTAITCDARKTPPETYARLELYSPPTKPGRFVVDAPTGSASACKGTTCTPVSGTVVDVIEVSSTTLTFTVTPAGSATQGPYRATFCGSFLGCG